MTNYREIVTKAIISKGKKNFISDEVVFPEIKPSTILGCWVINHNFKGYRENDYVVIEGNYDVNIWYSCNDDSKTEVVKKSTNYVEKVLLPHVSEKINNEEVIVRSLKQPTCIKCDIVDGKIEYKVEKELGIELVGDTKVKVSYDEEEEIWDEIEDIVDDNEIDKKIDEEVNEEFL